VVLAQEAAAQLGLERVLLVPTGRAAHKRIPDDPGAETRIEMAVAATDGDGLLEVERFEVEEAGRSDEPSYAYRTLESLAGEGIELARLAIAERRGVERAEVEAVLKRLGGARRATFVEMPEIGVSSTLVRQRVAAGKPIRYLVPEGVAELIARRGLYA
jgi:nicotinate-nucleotide adenylyltransferase